MSQALRENTYPFLAVIMLKDRRMTVVGRLEGLIQADDLINQLMFIMDANQTYLVSERLERYGGTGAAAAPTVLRQALLCPLPPSHTVCRHIAQHLPFCNTAHGLSSCQGHHQSIHSGHLIAREPDVLHTQSHH